MKIKLGHLEELNWWHPIETAAFQDRCKQYGVEFVQSGQDFDWIDVRFADVIRGPTILYDRHDTSRVTPRTLHESKRPEVVAITIPMLADDPWKSIAKHVYNYGEEYGLCRLPVGVVNTMPWYRCESEDIRQRFLSCDDDRPVTVSFCGTVQYGEAFSSLPWITQHRRQMIRHWPSLGSVLFARGCKDYYFDTELALDIMAQSKVVISPWGVCEISARDYEAALLRCVIVKPRQAEMQLTSDSPWTPDNTCYCEPDFSDLSDAIHRARELRSEKRDQLEQHARQLYEQITSQDELAKRVCGELTRIVEG